VISELFSDTSSESSSEKMSLGEEEEDYYSPYRVWEHRETLQAHGLRWTLRGHSIAAQHSGFYIDEWAVMLDAGLNSHLSPSDIFITHAHHIHPYPL
jgi:hypothetical protein